MIDTFIISPWARNRFVADYGMRAGTNEDSNGRIPATMHDVDSDHVCHSASNSGALSLTESANLQSHIEEYHNAIVMG